jgi:osmotically-inducible protein OsmY
MSTLNIALKNTFLCSVIIAAALTLQSCIPAVFVGGAVVGGTVISDSRGPKTMMDDHNIAYKAQLNLRNTIELRNSRIAVTTFNHVLVLVGQVPSADLRSLAEDKVRSIPKVKHIWNELEVTTPISVAVQTQDAWTTTQVKSKLIGAKNLNSAQIKVITENGVVYLLGLTTRNQARIAAYQASVVPGVTKVVELFEYTK